MSESPEALACLRLARRAIGDAMAALEPIHDQELRIALAGAYEDVENAIALLESGLEEQQ